MRQNDFQGRQGAFAPRKQAQPQQTQAFRPAPMPYPNPQMGGNYYQQPPQPQQMPPMQQQQAFMPMAQPAPPAGKQYDFDQMARDYNESNQNIRNLVNQDTALSHLDDMNDMLSTINTMDGIDDKVAVTSIDKVLMLIEQVAKQISEPKLFLPESCSEQNRQKLKNGGTKIATAMREYAKLLAQFKEG